MSFLGHIIVGFVVGPVAFIAFFDALAFPWHVAALVGAFFVAFIIAPASGRDMPSARLVPRAAIDLLAPLQ